MEQMSSMLQARIAEQQALKNSNQNNSVQQSYVDLTQKPDTFESSNKQEENNNKGKIAKIIAVGAAIVTATVGIIYAVKKGKAINLSDMTPDKFKQIQADKFTGKIKGNLKNGDKIIMEYTDGVLQKSTRKGKVNFKKVYETVNNEKIVKKTVNGITTEFNITKTQQEVKDAQDKLKSILNNKNLSSDELKKQTDAIQFKSNNQKKEIENAVNTKKKAEAELKAKLDAEEKAKLEAEAKERFEKQEKEIKEKIRKQAEAEEAKKAEEELAERIAYYKKADKVGEEILDSIDDKKFEEMTKDYVEFLDSQKIDYNHELVRHATTPECAESIRKNGYDLYHTANNNGTSTYGGMDVEADSLLNFGKRFGKTKLEYDFSGKALRLTDQVEDVLNRISTNLLYGSGKFNENFEYKGVCQGDIGNSFIRSMLKRLGYDAVILQQRGQDKFLTILEPNNTNVLKYVRTIPA